MMDQYAKYAEMFADVAEIGPEYDDEHDAIEAQHRVAQEEFRELTDEVVTYLEALKMAEAGDIVTSPNHDERLAEEMADVLITVHLLGEMMDIDLRQAYIKKMEYNMEKSADKDENGKITDDADIEKPNFGECHNE